MGYKSVVLTGDWHIKDMKDANRIEKIMDKHVGKIPMILMGDLLDTGINRGMQWDQECMDNQLKYLKAIIYGRKILGYVLGNHEDRIARDTGLNPYSILMGKEKFEYNIQGVKIAILHGTRVTQNPMSQLIELANIQSDANIVAIGHDHTLGVYTYKNQWLLRTGHLMEYAMYAKKKALLPKPMGFIKYSFKKDQPEIIRVSI